MFSITININSFSLTYCISVITIVMANYFSINIKEITSANFFMSIFFYKLHVITVRNKTNILTIVFVGVN